MTDSLKFCILVSALSFALVATSLRAQELPEGEGKQAVQAICSGEDLLRTQEFQRMACHQPKINAKAN
jgi:hypothetical protein